MGALRTRMIEEMKLRNFSPRTQQSYLAAVIGLVKHYRRSPDQLTQEEIRAYLLHLEKRGLSPSSRNVAISGMKFFYHQMLSWNDKQLFIAPRKRSWQLPEVLGQKEVERLLLAAAKQRPGPIAPKSKSAGLKSVMCRLRISDVGFAEDGYQDLLTRGGLEKKLYPSLEGVRNVQRLMASSNPCVGEIKLEEIVDRSFVRKLDDSGFIDRMYSVYPSK
jgi:hypothetical protein